MVILESWWELMVRLDFWLWVGVGLVFVTIERLFFRWKSR